MGVGKLRDSQRRIPPKAGVLVESLRDVGYSLQTAVADIIDNSITAGARNISLFAETYSDEPVMGILDDGCGMSETELIEAMRPGSKSPLDERSPRDLGRFGLGLKTASFSQCRRVTVASRRDGNISCAVWDLDEVAEADDWVVDFPSDETRVPWSEKLGETGTLVVWQKLDRLVGAGGELANRDFVNRLDEMARHLELVFHRFLEGEPGLTKVVLALNGRGLAPYDPFHSRHSATIRGPEESFRLGEHEIAYQTFTLPHYRKASAEDWEKHEGVEGYTKNQGFYVYREKRLIIYGTWFNLARQAELTKLARVRVDIPNGMDGEWKIDVKKASAQPPAAFRERLRRLVQDIGGRSKKVFKGKGTVLRDATQHPVWVRTQDKNKIEYGINTEHPAIEGFLAQLPLDAAGDLHTLLKLVSSTLPLDALFADVGGSPQAVTGSGAGESDSSEFVAATYRTLLGAGYEHTQICTMMRAAEPWQSNWSVVEVEIEELRTGRSE